MKNIWMLNHDGEPPTTGKNIRHYKFASELKDRGYNVKIFAASTIHTTDINYVEGKEKFKEKEIGGVKFIFIKTCNYFENGILRIKNMLEYSFRVIFVPKKLGNIEPPDIIYASSPHPLTWLSGYRLSRRYKCKYIAETRDLWPETLVSFGRIARKSIPARILYALEKYIYKRADKLVFTLPGGKDYVKSIGLDSSKSRYINNGIDIEEYNYNEKNMVYMDEDLDNKKTFKVVFAGAIGIANQVNNIVDAAKLLKDEGNSNIEFYIFGDGFEKEKLEEYAIKNNIDNVKFKGRVEKKYIPNILSKMDLNIFSLIHKPELFKYGLSPNKMFDYFASGHPVVSNVECGYDLLEEYKCGITVKGNSARALADGILKFYKMPKEEYLSYCNNALKAAEDFDFKVLTDKLEEVIEEI